MCRVNIRLDIAFYSAMKGTTGQMLKEENDPGLGRRLLYNMKLQSTTVFLGKEWPEMVLSSCHGSHCMTQAWKDMARPKCWKRGKAIC